MDKKGTRKNDITYHNKDVLSKVMAENFKDKSLKVYGIDVLKSYRFYRQTFLRFRSMRYGLTTCFF